MWFDLLVGVFDPQRAEPAPRLGMVVPKRLLRLAVLRNAVKRQAREAFRQRASGLPAVDVVLRLGRKPVAGTADFKHAARRDIDALLARCAGETR